MPSKKIWALIDDRAGNTSQTLGVAEALGLPFVTVKVPFSPFIRIPNALICGTKIGIGKATPELKAPWPDLVISCARRLGLVASYIKKQHKETFLAQIQWPGNPAGHFDFIATPVHDGIKAGGNVITTLGAPHRVTEAKLKSEAERWNDRVNILPRPRIAVLVGGSARLWKFTPGHAEKLAALASMLATKLQGSLMVTTSRRTGAEVETALAQSLRAPHFFHAWREGAPDDNPYYGLLGLADAVIATGDSVSMCSEACATGKPVFIYAENAFVPMKQRAFLQALYAGGYAKPLNADAEPFTSAGKLDDAAKVAAGIRERWKA